MPLLLRSLSRPSEKSWGLRKMGCNGSFPLTPSQRYVLSSAPSPSRLDPVVRQGCLLLLLGRLADLYGRKRMFVAGALWLAAFAIGCGFTNGKILSERAPCLIFSECPSNRRNHIECSALSPRHRRSCDRSGSRASLSPFCKRREI